MNADFFKKLLGQKVRINYQDGNRVSFAKGIIEKLDVEFLVVKCDTFVIAIDYKFITSCMIENGGDENS